MNRSSSRRSALADRLSVVLGRLKLRPGRVLVAVSGGVDSTVLLHLMNRLGAAHGLEPIVAHLDHGIHPQSSTVATLVEASAHQLGLPFVLGRLQLGAGTSETAARGVRRQWLEETRKRMGANYILLAHQADDQAETILMRLLRGSGPAGLAGMSLRRGPLVRPLLSFTRRTILRYARANQLEWWEDSANRNTRHLRSWLRADVLPVLAQRLPDVSQMIRAAGKHAASNRRAWTTVLRSWPGLEFRREGGVSSLNWSCLMGLDANIQVALLQAMARKQGVLPGPKRIRAAIRTLRTGQSGAVADLGSGWSLERGFDRLRLLAPRAASPVAQAILAGDSGEMSWGGFQVSWTTDTAPETQARNGDTAWFIPGEMLLRQWQKGDRLYPLGGRGQRLAVRCFQDAKVPASERPNWPILQGAGELAWIPGVCRSDRLVPSAGSRSLRVNVARRG